MAKFEDNLAALELIVDKLERGDLSLEDSVKLFEDGVGLSNACKAELEKAEGKVQVLIEQGKGRAVLTDLDVHADEGTDRDEAERTP